MPAKFPLSVDRSTGELFPGFVNGLPLKLASTSGGLLFGPSRETGNVGVGERVLFINNTKHNAFGDIVKLNSGRLIAFYREGDAHAGDTTGVLKSQYSDNNGATWSAASTVYTPPAGFDAREVSATLLPDGRVALTSWRNNNVDTQVVFVLFSTDDTATAWGSAITVTTAFTGYKACSGRLLRRTDGAYLVPIYGNNLPGNDITTTSSSVSISTDSGATWANLATIKAGDGSNRYDEHCIGYLADGTTIMSLIRYDLPINGRIVRSTSTDGGATWSATVDTGIAGLGNRPSWFRMPSGGIIVNYRLPTTALSAVATSWDEGVTWSPGAVFSDYQGVYGGFVALSDTVIGAAMYEQPSFSNADGFFQIFYDGSMILPSGKVLNGNFNGASMTDGNLSFSSSTTHLDLTVEGAGTGFIKFELQPATSGQRTLFQVKPKGAPTANALGFTNYIGSVGVFGTDTDLDGSNYDQIMLLNTTALTGLIHHAQGTGTAKRIDFGKTTGSAYTQWGKFETTGVFYANFGARIADGLYDTAGTYLLKLNTTASAANYLTYANAISGSNPTITATGSESNIGIDFVVKGLNKALTLSGGGNPDFQLLGAGSSGAVPDYSGLGAAPAITTSTIGSFARHSSLGGGASVKGFTGPSSGINPLTFIGYHGHTSPTVGAVLLQGFKHNGTTSATALASTEPVLDIQNSSTLLARINGLGSLSLGIGTVAAPSALVVGDTSTSSPRGIMSWQSNTGTDGARLHLRKSRGTFASPTTVVTGDTLGRLVATGHDGTGFLEMGSIAINATGTIATNRIPTQMVFSTATNASPSVLTTAVTIGADQKVTLASPLELTSGGTGSGTAAGARTNLQISDAGNVKVYRALISQSGTGDPTAVIMENSLGGTLVWSRSSAGQYVGTLSGAFPDANKTWLHANINSNYAPVDAPPASSFLRATANTVTLTTAASADDYFDDYLLSNAIEIRVYP